MSHSDKRVAGLSPAEKRVLLARLLRDKAQQAQPVEVTANVMAEAFHRAGRADPAGSSDTDAPDLHAEAVLDPGVVSAERSARALWGGDGDEPLGRGGIPRRHAVLEVAGGWLAEAEHGPASEGCDCGTLFDPQEIRGVACQ